MSEATIALLRSTDFIVAVIIGAVAVLAVIVWRFATGEAFPHGGVLMVGGAGVGLGLTGQLTPLLGIGLALLVVGGAVPARSPIARFALAIPGAAGIGAALVGGSSAYLPGIAVVVIAVGAPLVASFDRSFAVSTLATPIAVVTTIGIFFNVPDTEAALILVGACAAWIMTGPPARVSRLGGAGAYAFTGLVVWVVATDGAARPGAVAAGIGALGILVAVPVVDWLRTRSTPVAGTVRDGGTGAQQVAMAILQVAVVLLLAVLVRTVVGNVVVTSVLSLVVVAVVGSAAATAWPPPSDVEADQDRVPGND